MIEKQEIIFFDKVIDALINKEYQDEQYSDEDLANDITWRILKMYHYDK